MTDEYPMTATSAKAQTALALEKVITGNTEFILGGIKSQVERGLNFIYVDTLYWPAGSKLAVIHNLKSMGYKIKVMSWWFDNGFRVEW